MVRFQSIEESLGKIKVWAEMINKKAVYAFIIAISVVAGSFLAGKTSVLYKDVSPVILESCSMIFQATSTPVVEIRTPDKSAKGPYVGSRSSKKFHHESCPSVRLIKEANRTYFLTKDNALSNGYTPAGNCDM